MARTYIISADGTQYEATTAAQARRRRSTFRTIKVLTFLAMIPFLAAALVGVGMAATGNAPADLKASPAATSTTSLAKVDKACAKAGKGNLNACRALYLRKAWQDKNTYTPAGPALVKECIDQYRGIELRYCLTQPVK